MKKPNLIVFSAVAFAAIGVVAAKIADYDAVAAGVIFTFIGFAIGVFAPRSASED